MQSNYKNLAGLLMGYFLVFLILFILTVVPVTELFIGIPLFALFIKSFKSFFLAGVANEFASSFLKIGIVYLFLVNLFKFQINILVVTIAYGIFYIIFFLIPRKKQKEQIGDKTGVDSCNGYIVGSILGLVLSYFIFI